MSLSINHSYLCKQIIIEIEKTEFWEAWPKLTLDIEAGLIPDIAIYAKGKIKPNFLQDKIKCDIIPQLVIEIISPSQSVHELMLKAEKFIKAGISTVWTFEPYGKIVYISTKESRKVEVSGLIENEGVKLDLTKIFT